MVKLHLTGNGAYNLWDLYKWQVTVFSFVAYIVCSAHT